MKYIIQLLSLVTMLTISSSAMATSMCSTDDFQLDFVQLASEALPPLIINESSSDCLLLLGNDQPLPSGSNIGTYQDGLLNGEVWDQSPDPRLNPENY